ncbi:MAG: ATP-binding protein [Methanolobus sp.]|nr:ATP-binding protein [Methanolobus sp.]
MQKTGKSYTDGIRKENMVNALLDSTDELLDNGDYNKALDNCVKAYEILRSECIDSENLRKIISRLKKMAPSFFRKDSLEDLRINTVLEETKQLLIERKPDKSAIQLKHFLKNQKTNRKDEIELRKTLNSLEHAETGEKYSRAQKLKLALIEYECAAKCLERTRISGCLDSIITELGSRLDGMLKKSGEHIRAGDEASDLTGGIYEYRQAREILEELETDSSCIRTKIFSRIMTAFRAAEIDYFHGKFRSALDSFEQIKKFSEEEDIEIQRIEEHINKATRQVRLQEFVSIDLNEEMHCDVEYKIAVEVFNQFEEDVQVSLDLGDAKNYFKVSESLLKFPPVEKGKRLKRYITMKPLYEGEISFSMKIESSIIEHSKEITVTIKEPAEKVDVSRYANHIKTLKARSNTTWEDIGGLFEIKKTIMKNVTLAGFKLPEAIQPFRGILLYGPPGTGKSLLASAAAGSLDATFFNVSVSDIMSYWFGESSRIVQSLYDEARKNSPSIVFIDEMDSIAMNRSSGMYEGSRRLLSTLLNELSGFKEDNESHVLTIAATNTPWDLDDAVLSRFPLQVYIPLPDVDACEHILKIHLKGLEYDLHLADIARMCVLANFSGRDIEALCRQAVWEMLGEANPFLNELKVTKNRHLKMRPITVEDFKKSLNNISSSINPGVLDKYERFGKKIEVKDIHFIEGYQ